MKESVCAKMSHNVQNETIKLSKVQSSLTKKEDLSLQKAQTKENSSINKQAHDQKKKSVTFSLKRDET